MNARTCLALAALVAVRAPAGAQESIITDRPDFTESTATVARGRVQIEGGYTMTRTDGRAEHSIGEVLARIGLHRRLELRLAANSFVIADAGAGESVSGREDASAGVKIGIAPEPRGAHPSLALILATSLPSGSREFRQSSLQPETKLAASWSVTDRFGISTNLNHARLRDERGWYGESSASLSGAMSLSDRMGGYIEAYGFAPAARENQLILNGGLTLLLSPDFQLDARIGAAVSGPPDRFIGIGISRRI